MRRSASDRSAARARAGRCRRPRSFRRARPRAGAGAIRRTRARARSRRRSRRRPPPTRRASAARRSRRSERAARATSTGRAASRQRRVEAEPIEQLGVELRLDRADRDVLAVARLVDVVPGRAASRGCWRRARSVHMPEARRPENIVASSDAPSTIAASTTWPRPERARLDHARRRCRTRAACRRRRSRRPG